MTSADVFIIAHLMLCVHKHAKYTQASSHLRQAKPAKIQDCTESIILQKCENSLHTVHRKRGVYSTGL